VAFTVKDSGERAQFSSGMVRDTQEGKLDYWRVLNGPLVERLAAHLTRGASKYPDVEPEKPNWTLAAGEAEYYRFRASAFRHFMQWWRGDTDEDHFAAVIFNLNGAEYVREKLSAGGSAGGNVPVESGTVGDNPSAGNAGGDNASEG
jgi:hypothetical protein